MTNNNDSVDEAILNYVGHSVDTSNNKNNSNNNNSKSDDHDDFNEWSELLNDSFDNTVSQDSRRKSKKRRRSSNDSSSSKKKNRINKRDSISINSNPHQVETNSSVIDDRIHELSIPQTQNSINSHDNQLNEEMQAKLLAAAKAIVEEEDIYTTSNNNASNESPASSSTSTKRTKKQKPPKETSKTEPPELPKYDFSKISTEDQLIEIAAKKSITWFDENVPEDERKKPRPFSTEEDIIIDYYFAGYCHIHNWNREQLCNRIWATERKKDKFWKKIVKILPYRTQSSIYKHIRRRYHIFDKRAQWDNEEDLKLQNLSTTHPGNWKTIGEIMGRMPEDCRDRWRNYIKCGQVRTQQKWTPEEVNELVYLVNEMVHKLKNEEEKENSSQTSSKDLISKINWTIISERMKGKRSRIQCRYKWAKLNEKSNHLNDFEMSNNTKLWVLKKIKKMDNVKKISDINWDKISKKYEKDQPDFAGWSKIEFEKYIKSLVNRNKDEKKKFQSIIKDEISEYK
ncbi:hypothetical protein KGF54_005243 [Candida jiufengensis]|uniref:uncharacterized protein n=1 Tax=Candida jiufengensis TaxID=497108 RepID=UPI002225120C|nr:uncharacterized protein KGF54_005243 [Candida jiufengensis]KAI5950286.1 hypothetical protein KGF54_005243 [Candida jiufengensis]